MYFLQGSLRYLAGTILVKPGAPHLKDRIYTSLIEVLWYLSGTTLVKPGGLTNNIVQYVTFGTVLVLTSTALLFMPNSVFSSSWRRLVLSCLVLVLSLSSVPSYLSSSFLSISLFPRLKWIMRSLITKTWQLFPRLSPSTRCNALTSFPTSLIPDTPPTRCWKDVAMERYCILPSLRLWKEPRCC